MFQVLVQVDWSEVMFKTMEAADEAGMGVAPGNTRAAAWFFVIFVYFGVFVVVHLVLCVMLDTAAEMARLMPGTLFVSHRTRPSRRRRFLLATTAPLKLTYAVPKDGPCVPFRSRVYRMVTSAVFTAWVFVTISVNALTLCVVHYQAPAGLEIAVRVVHIACVGFFVIELLLKNIAYGQVGFV